MPQFADRVQRDLVIYRGDDNVFDYGPVLYEDGTNVDLTDAVYTVQIRSTPDSAVILATMAGSTTGDGANALFEIVLVAADAKTLAFEGGTSGVYDVQIVLGGGQTETPYYGTVTLQEDVSVAA